MQQRVHFPALSGDPWISGQENSKRLFVEIICLKIFLFGVPHDCTYMHAYDLETSRFAPLYWCTNSDSAAQITIPQVAILGAASMTRSKLMSHFETEAEIMVIDVVFKKTPTDKLLWPVFLIILSGG